MRHFVLNLKDEFAGLHTEQNPTLTCYLSDNFSEIEMDRRKPAVLVCPGGAYTMCSEREAEPIALNYLPHGFQTFVLRYSVAPTGYPQQLLEASAAIALIRRNATEWSVNPDAISVMGFSAGGHLAASVGTLWQEPFIVEQLGILAEENKPNALLLGYPVLTSDPAFTHGGTIVNLMAGRTDPALREKLSLEKAVGPQTPPTFIWHTTDDGCVPVENSLLFSKSLSKYEIPYELHIFPHGVHGLANCNYTTAAPDADCLHNPQCETWVQLSINWLKNLFI